jgi:hypothetical protein
MANKQISQLTAKPTPVAATDQFGIDDNLSQSYKITVANLETYFNGKYLALLGGTMTGALILNADPSLALGAATKQYVDNSLVGISNNTTTRVATTAALTVTYANGSSGVGATLTNAGAQAAIAIDGVTLALNDRVLVKDQASTLQNGIYTVTTLGSGASNWVMTRATDYDVVAEITPGEEVTVAFGTTNARTQWLETAVVATIGTDPITYQSNVVAGTGITKTNNSIAVNSSVVLFLSGGTMTGAINMGSQLITNLADPVSAQDAATRAYVLAVAQGRVFKDPCDAASTVALTVTYANGSSGVGATLTNAGAQAAFAIDGYTAALNDRILIKDQASSLQNGIYTVTDLGSGATNWVLTRSTDMDLAAEFKGATTFIISGTVNAGTTYTETATVVTIGTDPVTFVQTGDATGVTSVATAGLATGGPITTTGTITVTAATQTTQEAASSNAVAVTPGTQQFHPSANKVEACVTYSAGTPSIAFDYNVATLTDTATGDCRLNFDVTFSGVGNMMTVASPATSAPTGANLAWLLPLMNGVTEGRVLQYNITVPAAPALADEDFYVLFCGDLA